MVDLKVVKIEDRKYTLLNEITNKTFEYMLKFFDITKPVEVGDVISMHKELLDPSFKEYNQTYYFGDINAGYGRKFNGIDDVETIIVQQNNESIILKRFFG